MAENDELNKEDELVSVILPRAEAKILRDMIKERHTYNMMTQRLRSNWIWVVAAGALAIYGLADKFYILLFGAVK